MYDKSALSNAYRILDDYGCWGGDKVEMAQIDIYEHLDISLPLLQDMPEDASFNAGPAVLKYLLTHPNILDIAETIIGTPELYSNPIQHTRIKLSRHMSSSAEIFIPDDLIQQDKIAPLEVGKGGLVLLHQRTEHGSYSNESDAIRWSFDLRYHPIGQNSGREVFPGFIARSAEQPENVLTDPAAWAKSWTDTRERIIAGQDVQFNERWLPYSRHQLCA